MIHQNIRPQGGVEGLDGCHLCESCDRPRALERQYCPDCEEVTESYFHMPMTREEWAAHYEDADNRWCDVVRLNGGIFL